MSDILADRKSERVLAEKQDPGEAFLFDGSNKPLGVCVAVGSPGRTRDRFDASFSDDPTELVGVLRVPIVDQEPLAAQEPALLIGEVPTTCAMNSPWG